MKTFILGLIGSCFVAGAACGHHVSRPELEPRVSLCDLPKPSEAASGQRFRVSAEYFTDVIEHSGLVDSRCPSVVMGLALPRGRTRDKSVEAFEKAVMNTLFDPEGGRFLVEFTGVFVAGTGRDNPSYFRVEKVWSFRPLRPPR